MPPRVLHATPCPVRPADEPAELGEGPGWDPEDQELFWVDITGGWGHSAVHHYTPDGQLADIVKLPVTQPSSCCIGGPDGRTLVITTAREDLGAGDLAAQPDAGRLMRCTVGVTAPPAVPFAGRLPYPGSGPAAGPARPGRGEQQQKGAVH